MLNRLLSFVPNFQGIIKLATGLMIINAVAPLLKLSDLIYNPVPAVRKLFGA